jgi:hypothetical protein
LLKTRQKRSIDREASRLDSRALAMSDQEQAWRSEFERLSEQQVYDNVKQGAMYNDERKRQAAFRWLGEEARKRRNREEDTYWFSRWTFYVAIGAAAIAAIGVVVSWLH